MTLRGHTDLVNAVKFLPNEDDVSSIILSGSADKTIRVWRLSRISVLPELVTILEGHSGSVNCLAVFSDSSVVVSGAADGTLKVWRFSSLSGYLTANHVKTISLSSKFLPLALALHILSSDDNKAFILAVAGTRNIVQIFVSNEDLDFSLQVSLTGHEGWIRSLSFCRDVAPSSGNLLLASASQDKYIRLWCISPGTGTTNTKHNDAIDAFEQLLSNKRHQLHVSGRTFEIKFEALLLGHEDWIYSVSWALKQGRLQLLSASEDNSLAIWERENPSGIWVPTTRLGEISALKGSTTATGSAGGFWTALWSPTTEQLVSLGRTGSWRLWAYDSSQRRWKKGIGISGHTKSVMDIAWSKSGSYLLSTGSDQTTRLHAKWEKESNCSWHEIARPQIHGYDLNCVDSIRESQFISGADEKLLRVFDEPRVTANLLANLSGLKEESNDVLPETADIPVLGLSNKASSVDTNEKPADENVDGLEEEEVLRSAPSITDVDMLQTAEPPTEDALARHTLWPEKEKLYGHGHEISAVAVNFQGDIVATACKASSQDHAVIRLYSSKDWREIKPSLPAHSLTITCLRFSMNSQYLLSVGRDRLWALWELDPHGLDKAEQTAMDRMITLRCTNPKGHSRMILDADWAPTAIVGGDVFATAGRDKCAKVWSINALRNVDCVATINVAAAVTTVAIAPRAVNCCMMVALGTETGNTLLYMLNPSDWSCTQMEELDPL